MHIFTLYEYIIHDYTNIYIYTYVKRTSFVRTVTVSSRLPYDIWGFHK